MLTAMICNRTEEGEYSPSSDIEIYVENSYSRSNRVCVSQYLTKTMLHSHTSMWVNGMFSQYEGLRRKALRRITVI